MIKRNFLFLLAVPLFFSSIAGAEVAVTLPQKVKVVALNGKSLKTRGKVNVPDGLSQLVFRFEGELGRSKDAKMGYSDIFVVAFKGEKQHLRLLIPEIKNELQLKMFNQKPEIKLVDQTGRSAILATDKLEIEGFHLGVDYQQEINRFNHGVSPAAVNFGNASLVSGDGATDAEQKSMDSNAALAEKMLKYWFQQADHDTRRRFKKWLEQQ